MQVEAHRTIAVKNPAFLPLLESYGLGIQVVFSQVETHGGGGMLTSSK